MTAQTLTPPVCAIHQPNLFPRLSAVAKFFASDTWVVLDNVQFRRRDYQHRTRVGALDDAAGHQWLSLSVHLPHGRSTQISDAVIVDPAQYRRRVTGLLHQHYRRSKYWLEIDPLIEQVANRFGTSDHLGQIAELSASLLLDILGWRGESLRSSQLVARAGRTERLVDLCADVGARTYLCGTGGAGYLDEALFTQAGAQVVYCQPPDPARGPVWPYARRLSALAAISRFGVRRVRSALDQLVLVRPPVAVEPTVGCDHGARSAAEV